jgi:glycosyltransferase involved in cell wall biosynthesis
MNGEIPIVSVITATYNRGNVLRYAIESVLAQSFGDWELIVVGDACTDDTGAVMAAFSDPRIKFTNLERNFGEQSGPNNAGFAMSRGRYIAYLNHDDLWFPDHLETLVDAIEQEEADLVFSLSEDKRPGYAGLLGVGPGGVYTPEVDAPASSWLVRRELLAELGGWRAAAECYSYPSRDLLIRAMRAGKRLVSVPVLTVVAFRSGYRREVYARREEHENAAAWKDLSAEPAAFRQRELTAIAVQAASRAARRGGQMTAIAKAALRPPMRLLGIEPAEVYFRIKYGGKGAFMKRLRRVRGLPEPPEQTRP